jgi:hypothetical protein
LAVTTATPSANGAATSARPRRGVARVLYSPAGRFRSLVFEPGTSRTIGKDERADVVIADPELRGVHFELLFDGERFHAWLSTGSTGLAVDGRPATFGDAGDGGFVIAGRTTFGLAVEAAPPAEPLAPPAAAALAVLGPLRDAGRLYAVLDAARSPRVPALLAASVDEHASLYDGAPAAALDDVAPWVVRLDPTSRLLERVLHEGWGGALGVFFASDEPLRQARRHLRRFLMIEEVPSRQRYYFRFYDPRALREFWPIATTRQRGEIFGHRDRDARAGSVIGSLFWEREDATLERVDALAGAHAEPGPDDGRAHVPHP